MFVHKKHYELRNSPGISALTMVDPMCTWGQQLNKEESIQ